VEWGIKRRVRLGHGKTVGGGLASSQGKGLRGEGNWVVTVVRKQSPLGGLGVGYYGNKKKPKPQQPGWGVDAGSAPEEAGGGMHGKLETWSS